MTFRMPGLAGQGRLDRGRDERRAASRCGLGAGWNEQEHGELGIPYPEDKVRVDILEETLQLFHGLWDEPDGWTMDGEHVKVAGSLFRPKDQRPPILVGGSGRPRSVRLAATYADEHNLRPPRRRWRVEVNAEARRAVREGRARPGDARAFGDDRRARREGCGGAGAPDRRAAGRLRPGRRRGESWLDARRDRWAMGLPDEARARCRRSRTRASSAVMLQTFLPFDLEHITLHGRGLPGLTALGPASG